MTVLQLLSPLHFARERACNPRRPYRSASVIQGATTGTILSTLESRFILLENLGLRNVKNRADRCVAIALAVEENLSFFLPEADFVCGSQ